MDSKSLGHGHEMNQIGTVILGNCKNSVTRIKVVAFMFSEMLTTITSDHNSRELILGKRILQSSFRESGCFFHFEDGIDEDPCRKNASVTIG